MRTPRRKGEFVFLFLLLFILSLLITQIVMAIREASGSPHINTTTQNASRYPSLKK
ncbi:MAG: hypothetical protein JXR76_01835 [Deltaproteobacteria bacterium]|nr:hypothetical protein [Deltaproteobacteria bacterium]